MAMYACPSICCITDRGPAEDDVLLYQSAISLDLQDATPKRGRLSKVALCSPSSLGDDQ